MKQRPANHAYKWIEPGPIALVVTQDGGGRANVMTMGFHMMVEHDPPTMACVIGPWDHSFAALRQTGECVLAIPPAAMAQAVVDIGNCSGAEVDKFARFALATRPAEAVAPPLLAGCLANLECRVIDDSQVAARNLWVLAIERLWVAEGEAAAGSMLHHRGDGSFVTDGPVIDHSERMVKWRDLPG